MTCQPNRGQLAGMNDIQAPPAQIAPGPAATPAPSQPPSPVAPAPPAKPKRTLPPALAPFVFTKANAKEIGARGREVRRQLALARERSELAPSGIGFDQDPADLAAERAAMLREQMILTCRTLRRTRLKPLERSALLKSLAGLMEEERLRGGWTPSGGGRSGSSRRATMAAATVAGDVRPGRSVGPGGPGAQPAAVGGVEPAVGTLAPG